MPFTKNGVSNAISTKWHLYILMDFRIRGNDNGL